MTLFSALSRLVRLLKIQEEISEYINYISCIENIVYMANHLIEMDYHLKENETFITGMKKLVQFINTDISVFYRRIIDAFNFAADYWSRFYNLNYCRRTN